VRKVAKFITLALGSAIVALVLGLFVAGVSSSGVALLELTHAFFWACFAVGVLAAIVVMVLARFSARYVVLASILTAVCLGWLLYETNAYLTRKKAELDASNHPPVSVDHHIPAPPNENTVKSKPPRRATAIEHNGSSNDGVPRVVRG